MHAALCTERVVTPAQDTANALKLVLQPAKSSTNMMPPDGDSGVTHSGPLNETPLDNHLLAEKPGAGGAPPCGAILDRPANKDQVNTTEEGVTLDCGRDKVWQVWDPGDSFRALVIGRRPGLLIRALGKEPWQGVWL